MLGFVTARARDLPGVPAHTERIGPAVGVEIEEGAREPRIVEESLPERRRLGIVCVAVAHVRRGARKDLRRELLLRRAIA